MATVGNTYLTLADVMKQENPDHQAAAVIELLSQHNEILMDAHVMECNDGTRNLTTLRTSLPSVERRSPNKGTTPGKSTTKQVSDATTILEKWSEVDALFVDGRKSGKQVRLNQAKGFLQALNNEMATALFYDDSAADPTKMMGLAPRFNSLSAEYSNQIIDAGGTGGDNTSIWFVVWGPTSTSLIYPEGTDAGMTREDKGKETKEKSDGTLYNVYRELFTWQTGLAVMDWRYVSRIANIDVSDLTANASSGADLEQLMIDAYYALYQRKVMNGRAAIYCNTRVKRFLHKQSLKSNASLNISLDEISGKEVVNFIDMPIREVDAILNTESRVV